MFFHQVINEDLGCASYVLGDAGEAVVVDPRWDIDVYLDLAAREHARIAHVIDTHDHADHRSGRPRLAALGAVAHRPARADDWLDGDLEPGAELRAGAVRLRALATPGHRPEHLSLAVADLSRDSDPWLVLTGDSLLIGDLARPDLAVDAELGARELRRSVGTLLELGDHVEIWPGHVGGSLCGGPGLSAKTSSTIGYERLHNALVGTDEAAFADELLAQVPPKPPHLGHIVALNRQATTAAVATPGELSLEELRALTGAAVALIDVREPDAYDSGHLEGAINLPAQGRGVGTRAGWAIGVDERSVIVADELAAGRRAATLLECVGFSVACGIAVADPDGWRRAGLSVAETRCWGVAELASALHGRRVALVDVRDRSEWADGHVPGSMHLPLDQLQRRPRLRLPDGPVAVACAAGGRAAFAASVLRRTLSRPALIRVGGGGIGDLPAHGVALAHGT